MRVLVVDDDVTVATGVSRCLAAEGFDVEMTHDGMSALEQMRAGRFDLLVLDLLLPALNGYRVCRTLRAEEDWTPILMLTAKTGEYDEAEGLESGADDFLTKPFSMVVLQARVRALLRRPRHRDEGPSFGGLRLDPLHRRCLRDSHAIGLTAREMEVLALLVERAGTTVSRADILDSIWGRDFDGDPAIVEVYVSRLRRKIDAPFARPLIDTVRGEGYRLLPGDP